MTYLTNSFVSSCKKTDNIRCDSKPIQDIRRTARRIRWHSVHG